MKSHSISAIIFLPVIFLGLPGCYSSSNAPSETVKEIIAADNLGDLEKVLSLYTDDAILMPADKQDVVGKDAIRQNYQGIFENSLLQLTPQIEEEMRAGTIAIVKGTITGTVASKKDAGRAIVNDKFIMLLKIQSGGWKIHRLMWSRKG